VKSTITRVAVPLIGSATLGIDGPETNVAVRSFQGGNGLVVDGIVGPATGTKILAIDDAHGETLCYNVVPTYS
jgi:murein L,D-transpeptidase YcbB/YkuD